MRARPGPTWSDADAELARTVAGIFARALRTAHSDRLLSLTYREGPLGFSIRTLDGILVDCNHQYLNLLGVGRDEAEHHGLEEAILEPHRSSLADEARRLRTGEIDELRAECEYQRADGSRFWARTNTVQLLVPGSSERFLLTSVEDITENQAQRIELEFAARHDPLTGVANRNELADAIERYTRQNGEAPALVAIDLDRFKAVNDAFGHIVGDEVLKVVAARVASEVRSDDVVARLGGDEFAIVAPRLDAGGAAHLAERLLARFAEPVVVEGGRIDQRTSIGIALGEGRTDGHDLLVRADRALYAAKQRGRDGFVLFDDSMQDEVLHRLELERDLRVAIDRSQLEVHFQPEFSLVDGHVLGVEALLRWEHPGRGQVPADEFIVVAEQSGLIAEIGRFALHTACRVFRTIVDELDDDELVLRINISAREFARPELPDVVASALDAAGLPARRLCLEMTETTLMDAPELALTAFTHLQEVGVKSAIDDFGTGYSSLSYLKRFPVDCVKIDRAFVVDVDDDPDTRAIVESIMGLAEAMDLEVVAEGVETEEQSEVLRRLGCERAQGFLVSGALPAPDVVDLIRRRRRRHATTRIDLAAVAG
jgi:diguanylate cyclase (GGDEF)-like protein/PAS domain S-box-containing protein